MPESPKAWVLTKAPNFGPNGALQLGQLLTNPYDANSTVIARKLAPIPLDALRDNLMHSNVDFSSEFAHQTSFRLWLRSENKLIPAKGAFDASKTSAEWAKYKSSTVVVHMFPPDDEYAEEAVQAAKTQRSTKISLWAQSKKLYLVTGLRILANDTSVDLWSAERAGHHAAADVDFTPANVPLGTGTEMQGEHARGESQKMKASSFVYAYRLHEVTKRREPDTASVKPWAKGKLHSLDPDDVPPTVSHLHSFDIQPGELGDATGLEEEISEDETSMDEPPPSGAVEDDEYIEFAKISETPFQGDGTENELLVE